MIFKSMFEKILFVVTVNNDVIGFEETGSLEKCGKTVLETVSSTEHWETIKNEITLVARLLQ